MILQRRGGIRGSIAGALIWVKIREEEWEERNRRPLASDQNGDNTDRDCRDQDLRDCRDLKDCKDLKGLQGTKGLR